MSHAIIAGREIENVDPNRILSNKIVNEQKTTFGDVSEWLYRGINSMINVKNSTTAKKKLSYWISLLVKYNQCSNVEGSKFGIGF